MKGYSPHSSMRGYFANEIHRLMAKNDKIWVLTTDLGYKMWDRVRQDFPDRFVNAGAAEQATLGIAVGLALEGKIPIVYSITTFGLYRPFECIRNYINHERIPVKLCMSGRDRDYAHDGFSHWAEEDKKVLQLFENIDAFWPQTIEEIPRLVRQMISSRKPWYINLRR